MPAPARATLNDVAEILPIEWGLGSLLLGRHATPGNMARLSWIHQVGRSVAILVAALSCDQNKQPEPKVEVASASTPTASVSEAAAKLPPKKDVKLANEAARYAVVSVVEGDFLNVRAETTGKSEKVAALNPDGQGVVLTGKYEVKGDNASVWVEVDLAGKKGWVNRYYLAEQPPTANVCRDPKTTSLIGLLRNAVKNGDGELLVDLASPARGLMLRYTPSAETLLFREKHKSPAFQLARFFEKKDARYPYTLVAAGKPGGPIKGSIEELVLPGLQAALDGQAYCGNIPPAAGNVSWPTEFQALTPYALRGKTAEGEESLWVVGIEYAGARPFVGALVRFQ